MEQLKIEVTLIEAVRMILGDEIFVGEEIAVYLTSTPEMLIYTLISHDSVAPIPFSNEKEYSPEYIVTIHAGRSDYFTSVSPNLGNVREANLCESIVKEITSGEDLSKDADVFIIKGFEFDTCMSNLREDSANMIDVQLTGNAVRPVLKQAGISP